MREELDNISSSAPQIKPFDEKKELWTTECLVDELFLCLARKRERVSFQSGKTIAFRSYYRQAIELMRWIPITKPPSEFVIYISDLTPEIKKEIESIGDAERTLQYVLTQAIGRIFENLDSDRYHTSIAQNLKVRLEP
jgi:hypothetical protein